MDHGNDPDAHTESDEATSMKFTKSRCFWTVVGIVFYVVDIGTDVWVAVQYFREGRVVWCSLTCTLVFGASLCSQVFSYAWFRDDLSAGDATSGMADASLATLHVLQLGVFARYYQLLKKAAKVLLATDPSEQKQDLQRELIAHSTDLSMLRLFETFLESAPQLLLQLYIILAKQHGSVIQFLCIVVSFFNIAWATVDYRRCFRRSLPHINEMPRGTATVVYLLYKLFTVSSRILSLSLLLVLSIYCGFLMAVLWLAGALWAHTLQTDFCTSKGLEKLYRCVIGVILLFTFFNVKGQHTKVPMIVYYSLYTSLNILMPPLVFLTLATERSDLILPVTVVIPLSGVCTVIGLFFLALYYIFLHPRPDKRDADTVDGLQAELTEELEATRRMKAFLHY